MAQPPAQTKAAPQRRLLKKGLFAKDLGPMMYGFGDDYNSAPDTIQVMEELVIDHITDICMQAHRISTNRGKIKVDDFRFALRNDSKKLSRLDELLFMQEEIARARRGFEDPLEFAGADDDDDAVPVQAVNPSTSSKPSTGTSGALSTGAPAAASSSSGSGLPAGTGQGEKSKKAKGKEKA
ncbi:hypothetical protein JCM10212_006882 [Sporobolomyces blumeae]